MLLGSLLCSHNSERYFATTLSIHTCMLVVGERNIYFLKMFESDAWNLIVMSQVCCGISGKFQKSSIIIEPKNTFLFNNSTQSLFSN